MGRSGAVDGADPAGCDETKFRPRAIGQVPEVAYQLAVLGLGVRQVDVIVLWTSDVLIVIIRIVRRVCIFLIGVRYYGEYKGEPGEKDSTIKVVRQTGP